MAGKIGRENKEGRKVVPPCSQGVWNKGLPSNSREPHCNVALWVTESFITVTTKYPGSQVETWPPALANRWLLFLPRQRRAIKDLITHILRKSSGSNLGAWPRWKGANIFFWALDFFELLTAIIFKKRFLHYKCDGGKGDEENQDCSWGWAQGHRVWLPPHLHHYFFTQQDNSLTLPTMREREKEREEKR